MTEFEQCTTKKVRSNGSCSIECKLGLWSVDSYDELTSISEALHYFNQYKSDGEYSDIIGGDDVITTMMKNQGGAYS